jgi:hypothetical protein
MQKRRQAACTFADPAYAVSGAPHPEKDISRRVTQISTQMQIQQKAQEAIPDSVECSGGSNARVRRRQCEARAARRCGIYHAPDDVTAFARSPTMTELSE